MTKHFERILGVAIVVWGLVALLRTGTHLFRVYSEFRTGPVLYWPEIAMCAQTENLTTEQKYSANYRSLGVKCSE